MWRLFALLLVLVAANSTQLEIPETNAWKNCVRTLLNIQKVPLLAANCCLTKLCSNRTVFEQQMMHGRPTLLELFRKLCAERLYLLEQSGECVLENNLNMQANNTNSGANCSQNFQKPINTETAMTHSEISDENKANRKLDRKSTSPSFEFSTASFYGADKKIKFENITRISARISGLQFLDVPKGEEMRIHNLRLEEEYLLFEVFSTLIAYLQPNEFPTDLVREAVQNHIPFHLFALQLLKTEVPVLIWLIFWTIVTISIPFSTIIYICCSNRKIQRLTEDASDSSQDFREKCVERALIVMVHCFLILLMIPIILIFVANEQISRQMSRSQATTDIIFQDLNNFISNTHMQISFVATSSMDITIEAIRTDLDDIENLLGIPYQEELAKETGIDRVLTSLVELTIANGEVTRLVASLLRECELANEAAKLLREQLKEVSRQLTIARQQCRREDRALCYTLQYTGLNVAFSCGNLTSDLKIRHLDRMEKEKSFNNSVENARITFQQLPQRVSQETLSHVAEIKNVLSKKRTEIYKAAHSLDEAAIALQESVKKGHTFFGEYVDIANEWEMWRWLATLGISTILSLVWALLLCGAPCGCGLTSRTIPLLLSGVIFSGLICLLVWSLGSLSFLFGSHGQSIVCQPLYDQPMYKALANIFDSGGILFKEKGVLGKILKKNDSLKIVEVLRSCERNLPAYATFNLHSFFDTNLTNYESWYDLKSVIGNFSIGENGVEILSPTLQLNLQVLSTISTVNLTKLRVKISGPVTKRDLSSLADQLNDVARQLTDLTSSKRIDNLALMVRRIIQNELATLNELRNRILYKITALDVLIYPISKQANQSLNNLKAIQFFLDNQRWLVAEKTTRQFTSRLEKHLSKLHNYTVYKVTKEIGKCKPLWEIFHSTRFFICKLLVDPTNGISVSSFALILLFFGIIPVVLKLVEHYRELISEELLTSITHRRARDGLIIDDEGTWATPSSGTPPETEMRNMGQGEPIWTTPSSKQTSEPLIPPPPKPLASLSTRITSPKMSQVPSTSRVRSPKRFSTIASRISGARVPQIPSVSRARSPKRGRHESLRLIEPICWKSGSTSPRSWL